MLGSCGNVELLSDVIIKCEFISIYTILVVIVARSLNDKPLLLVIYIIGNAGIVGNTGIIGNTGIVGNTGIIGNTGIVGNTGIISITGIVGIISNTGIVGR